LRNKKNGREGERKREKDPPEAEKVRGKRKNLGAEVSSGLRETNTTELRELKGLNVEGLVKIN